MAGLKAFCYVVRTDGSAPQLLAFTSLDEPGFEVPKGAVESGETLEEAALREILEESGITTVQVVRELGVTHYLGEEQHFLLLKTTQKLPVTFTHIVTGEGVDRGFQYDYQWLGVTPALSGLLVQGCDRFVSELVTEVSMRSVEEQESMQRARISVEDRVILFMDVHDYSVAVTALGKTLYGFLQETYERLGDIIVAHNGEILKYLGDAILCVFPADRENNAVDCAKKLREAFAGLVKERRLPPDTELEIGIGSGEIEIGIFGHRSLLQKDAFGQAVIQAAVIGHHRGIAITENVYERIKADYETNRLPDIEVKWQDEPLKVWEVEGKK
jgi:class 3 adenylate cyclase/8-oxo-dGTP pyrophosphatase MutT (NUDIX family)